MKAIISAPLKNTIYNLMRDAGYHFQRQEGEEFSFVRPKYGFPRFHIYAKIENGNLSVNLHLDQKKPVYDGATAHSGDYDEPIVAKEMERIKVCLQNQS